MVSLPLCISLSIALQASPTHARLQAPAIVIHYFGTRGHFLSDAPKSNCGLLLDETGQPSTRTTALALLFWISDGVTLRSGAGRKDVRQGCKALLQAVTREDWGRSPHAQRFHDEALIALALYSHARIGKHVVLHLEIQKNLADVFKNKRLKRIFPQRGPADPGQDDTRILYFLLWKQIQIVRASHALRAMPQIDLPEIPWIDPAPMRLWLERCNQGKSLSSHRLLLRLLGQLILDPPKERALNSRATGLLWKRALSAMVLEQVRSRERTPARILFIDTLLRNEFLTHAFPQQLRKSRKKEVDAWNADLREKMSKVFGLSEEDLYRLLMEPIVYNYSRWWE